MDLVFLGYVGIFVVSAVASFASVPRARDIQHPETRRWFVVFLLSVGVWSSGYVGYFLAQSKRLAETSYTLGFIAAFVAVVAWLGLSAAYTGRSTRRVPYRRIAIVIFLVIVGLKLTNPLHTLYYTTEWTTEPFTHLAINHGLLYWVVLGLSYAVVAVGFTMLLERFHHTGADTTPLVALVALSGLPAIATVLGGRIPGLLPLMYEPPGVALFAVGTLFVYFRRFEAIQYAAESDDPAIFLDNDGRIRDFNRAAETLFPQLEGSIGESIEKLVPAVAARRDETDVIEHRSDDEIRYFRVTASPFTSGDVTTGQLVTITDVTDEESYRRRLEEKTEQLEVLNRVVRHDIRNDMSVILGWAETLDEHVDDAGKEALERVLQKTEHVIELTNVTRDFVESLAGIDPPELSAVDLREQLELELTAARESFPDAEIRVAGEIPSGPVRANELLDSVFRNLLINAIIHNDSETPEISVAADERDETIQVRIADDGPGIPDERKEEIFGKGKKGLESAGSGIGLYLVSTLLDQFGGDVWVEDNEPRGSVFVVELQKMDE